MTWVGVIEASYAACDDEATWLRGVVAASRPLLDAGFGLHGLCFANSPTEGLRLGPVVDIGYSDEMRAAIQRTFGQHSAEAIRRVLHPGGCITLSRLLADLPDDLEMYGDIAGPLGCLDAVGVVGGDPSGVGFMLAGPLPERDRVRREAVKQWARVAAHIVAGYRLHRAHAARPPAAAGDAFAGAEAVLDRWARVQHAQGVAEAPLARIELREAAINLMRVRAHQAEPHDTSAAVASWRALVAGRWSLVDHFDNDGQRFLIARRNDPGAPMLADLTLRERQVAGYAALGHSNKLIAYSLGLSPTTVATHLARAAKKLRVGSRAALITAYQSFATPSTERGE